mmetsp:Transcript_8298/g.21423  ORF Transcript_8298/g.21423 Transcript_8298/m.21423 type:complete len:239 (-) Transcript_8298:396-1112(-)
MGPGLPQSPSSTASITMSIPRPRVMLPTSISTVARSDSRSLQACNDADSSAPPSIAIGSRPDGPWGRSGAADGGLTLAEASANISAGVRVSPTNMRRLSSIDKCTAMGDWPASPCLERRLPGSVSSSEGSGGIAAASSSSVRVSSSKRAGRTRVGALIMMLKARTSVSCGRNERDGSFSAPSNLMLPLTLVAASFSRSPRPSLPGNDAAAASRASSCDRRSISSGLSSIGGNACGISP